MSLNRPSDLTQRPPLRRTSQPLPAIRESEVARKFERIRHTTCELCSGLSAEDLQIQSMPDASPGKWHLAHTSWFFEQFVLQRDPAYAPYDAAWHVLFNSYYQSAGPIHERSHRGLLSRPALEQVYGYREHVDAAILQLLSKGDYAELIPVIELGLQHEQQHQELLLTDIKHALSCNPLQPVYRHRIEEPMQVSPVGGMHFIPGREGIVEIGHDGVDFCFDNEMPRHQTLLHPHALANRLVTNIEYAEFIQGGGYRNPALWLAEGWAAVQREGWQHPLYWQADMCSEFTLDGLREINRYEPVCHISYFEAEAFARWAGARLPTEAEWEAAAQDLAAVGNFQDEGLFHPRVARAEEDGLAQIYGDAWEWTASPYVGYPGFKSLPGTLGEYNGKFMSSQWVLRGGSCATPQAHIRASYRNFFPPDARWQFSGLRLGQDR